MNTLRNILNGFDSITLDEMDSVTLMDRVDSKYAFTQDRLTDLFERMKPSYRVLEVNTHRISRYESVYFDTKDFDLYHHHHTGRTNRYKIRFRKYVESDLSFFEIKFKNNKDRTIKSRVRHGTIEEIIQGEPKIFLSKKTHFTAHDLEAKLWVNFSRITFVNRFSPERVTIDLDLTFKNNETVLTMNNLVIAETKQNKSMRSEFVKLMKEKHIREGSISKYCFAASCLYKELKNNNFRPQLKIFNKLICGNLTSA